MEYYKIQEPVLVIQGDNIFRLDVRKALEYHDKKEAMMTIILKNGKTSESSAWQI